MLNVIYSVRARKDILVIKSYLLEKFTQREVDNFYKLLQNFEPIVIEYPQLFPKSTKNENVHRAVLSKKLSVFYKIKSRKIFIVAIMDNRMDPERWL